MHTKYVTELYKRLLADIRAKTESLNWGAPVDVSYEWLLLEGPKLDKEILAYIDGKRDGNIPLPQWIKPLWDGFIESHLANIACRAETPYSMSTLWSDDASKYLKYMRQLLVFVYKAEHEPTHEQLVQSQKDFEETDGNTGMWASHFSSGKPTPCLSTARQYVGKVIYRINWSEITPRHGPGGIFPSRRPMHKSNFTTYYERIAAYYPYDQHMWAIPSFWNELMLGDRSRYVRSEEDIVAKLTAVPKDSRGPRLICVHPAESIWIQQGQRKLLENAINQSPLTRGKVNFTDQSVNGSLALSSSDDMKYVTIDLKEASDRISCELVRYLFGDHAYAYMSCSRANKIKLLDGRVMTLEKWAPMGNCLTFPVQSLIFYSLVRAGIRCRYGVNCNDIYVFGDDILFPTEYYEGAVKGLMEAGLVVNYQKTFHRGLFRESCGVDAYSGVDVTPLRLKKWDISRLDGIMSQLDLAHRLVERGHSSVADYIYGECRRALRLRFRVKLPYSNNIMHGGLFEYVPWFGLRHLRDITTTRRNRKLQRIEARSLHVRARVERVQAGDWYHLMDSLLRIGRMPASLTLDETELEVSRHWNSGRFVTYDYAGATEYPVPYRTRLQYGWTEVS